MDEVVIQNKIMNLGKLRFYLLLFICALLLIKKVFLSSNYYYQIMLYSFCICAPSLRMEITQTGFDLERREILAGSSFIFLQIKKTEDMICYPMIVTY